MPRNFVDAHLHLQDQRLIDKNSIIAQAEVSGICRFFCNATEENDWPHVVNLAQADSRVIPFLGIHPWFCETVAAGWQQRLRKQLCSCPHEAGIGETGLDRSRSTDVQSQQKLFEAHLEIAADLGLPVAVHCVRAWEALLNSIKHCTTGRMVPKLMVHAYNGSKETMHRLVELGCFISYSTAIANPRNTKIREAFLQTPISALLLETDSPFQYTPELIAADHDKTTCNEPKYVSHLYQFAADLRAMPLMDLAKTIWENATIFTNKTPLR